MANAFVSNMQKENNWTLTENGALAMKSTNSDIVDLFGTIGSLRSRPASEVERLFAKAFAEDKLLATKMAFYARNVRGGLGERETPRIIWRYLAMSQPEIMRKNLQYIPFFGRWDDLYCLMDTPVEQDMWSLIRTQFEEDWKGMQEKGSISLMAKWLKNTNSKNATYAKQGMRTARALKMSDKEYRQAMTALRAYLDIVEVNMSKGDFSAITYSAVSSRAMTRYRKAFAKKDAEGFQAYLDSLTKGETKVNASTLYPYDIMEQYGLRENYSWGSRHSYLSCGQFDTVLEEQWKALPNYVEGENNVLVMADTSGSMSGRPLASAVGLAIYFAERNKGAFKDVFMTFSHDPKFVTLKGSTLKDRIGSVEAIVADTDIEKAFKRILEVSVANKVPAEDMPKALVIISDMEFNSATRGNHKTYYEHMSEMYAEAGYTLPTIIFWNVASRQDVFHVACDKKGVQLASGQSASTFKSIMANIGKTPYQAVVDTLNTEMYAMITV